TPTREGLDRRGPDCNPRVRRRVVRHRHEADELAVRTARMDDVLDAREDREVRVVEHVYGHAQEAGRGQGRAQQEDAEDRQRQEVSLAAPRSVRDGAYGFRWHRTLPPVASGPIFRMQRPAGSPRWGPGGYNRAAAHMTTAVFRRPKTYDHRDENIGLSPCPVRFRHMYSRA